MSLNYRFNEFYLDTHEESLHLAGVRVNINRKAYQVLLLLVQNAGNIVTKQQFFDTVWGNTFVEDNSLTVTMTTLRKVLGDTARDPKFIENLPRKGYRFISEVKLVQPSKPVVAGSVTPNTSLEPPKAARRTILVGATICCLLVLLVVAGFNFFDPSRPLSKNVSPQFTSLAVLPFENSDPALEYISDGLAEGLISSLGDIPDIRVISRNSAFKFKGKTIESAAIKQQLNIDSLLTGRVEQRNGMLAVDAKLTDLTKGSDIWEKHYEVSIGDSLALRSALLKDVSQTLSASGSTIKKRGTADAEAYNFYLKGRQFWNKRNDIDFQKAIRFYQQALDHDPAFALAHAGLAMCYAQSSLNPGELESERSARVIAAATKALEFDSNLGEAYAIIALTESYHQWNMSAAAEHYKLAIELEPGNSTNHHWYAEFLEMHGRFDESSREFDIALERDPLSPAIVADRAYRYYYARDYDRAITELEKARSFAPTFEHTHYFLYTAYEEKGMFETALASLNEFYSLQQKNGQLTPERLERYIAMSAKSILALKKAGKAAYWQERFEFYRYVLGEGPSPIGLSVNYSRLGDQDKAFEFLEKALESHNASLVWLKVSPEFDGLRADPRFASALSRVGF